MKYLFIFLVVIIFSCKEKKVSGTFEDVKETETTGVYIPLDSNYRLFFRAVSGDTISTNWESDAVGNITVINNGDTIIFKKAKKVPFGGHVTGEGSVKISATGSNNTIIVKQGGNQPISINQKRINERPPLLVSLFKLFF